MRKNTTGREENRIVVEKNLVRDTIADAEKSILRTLKEIRSGPVVLDLSDTTRIDSKGFSLCIHLSKLCASKNLPLRIVAGPDVYKFFVATRLTAHLDIVEKS
jgi:ABC-type transporter Mla MlaB component